MPRVALRAGCLAAAALLAWPWMRGYGSPVPPPGPALRMLDVGQGAAVALRDGARVEVLVDAGPPVDCPRCCRGSRAWARGLWGR